MTYNFSAWSSGTPGAGSDSTGRDSVPATRREFKRVKERLVHFNEHIRKQLKLTHEALQKEKEFVRKQMLKDARDKCDETRAAYIECAKGMPRTCGQNGWLER